MVILACALVQVVALKLAAESQVTRPAAVAMVGVIALELLIKLSAHVVVTQAGLMGMRWTHLRSQLRGRRGSDRGAVQSFGLLSPFGREFGSFGGQRTKHVQRVQKNQKQQKVLYTHARARLQDP